MNGEATHYIHAVAMPAALSLLPGRMDSPAARAMVLATGLQESRLEHRRQLGGGPARGLHQFEKGTPQTRGGVTGVLMHEASKPYIEEVLTAMGYDTSAETSYTAIEHNDVLDCVYARLLLWTSPRPLPKRGDAHGGWNYYRGLWRPGNPRAETWAVFYAQAWEMVEATNG